MLKIFLKESLNILKELLSGRRSIGIDLRRRDRHAQWCVPLVITTGPGQDRVDGRQRSHKVVYRPSDDSVVVHAHVDVYHAYCIAYSCGHWFLYLKLMIRVKGYVILFWFRSTYVVISVRSSGITQIRVETKENFTIFGLDVVQRHIEKSDGCGSDS